MKFFILLLSVFTLNAWSMSKVQLMSGRLYIPEGYDTNDMVEVTVIASLPDTCHRNPTYEVVRNDKTFNISLHAHYVADNNCKKISIPYQANINLGLLEAGTYNVQLRGASKNTNSKLSIIEARSALQDDFKYGNVMNILEDEDSREIELSGINPSKCLVFEQLETEIQKDVIVIRPHFREEGVCKDEPSPFTIKYEVPFLRNQSRGILLHVRIMGGRSLSYLFKNKI